eukprot:342680-Lingulodinium_polyedra.AAC.1
MEKDVPLIATPCHVTQKDNLPSILRQGLVPRVMSGQSGATEFQMSPAFPFDTVGPARASFCGRANARDYGLPR